MRVYTKLREILLTHKDILLKLEQLETTIIKQDKRIGKHEDEIQLIFNALKQLLHPQQQPRKQIGYRLGKDK